LTANKQRKVVQRARGRVTIRDVAQSCGVSEATVSNALADKPYVSRETRELVLKAVAKLGYFQSPIAKALRTGRTDTIGVVVSNLSNPFYAEVLLGISQVLTPAGYQAIICNTESNPELQTRHINNLLQRSVDGIILISQPGAGDVAGIQSANVPLVSLWRVPKGGEATFVGLDEDLGMRAALDHLWSLGHRSIALLRGVAGASTAEAREHAFREFLRKKKRTVPAGYIVHSPSSIEGGRAAAQRLLKLPQQPTAIIATGDLVALGATVALAEAGLDVPRYMSVVGYDDTFIAKLPQVDLTCVSPPRLELGTQGAQALLRKIADPKRPIERILLEPGFSLRSTTAAPRG